MAEALAKFFEDARARGLSSSTIGKQKNILEKRLLPWAEKHGGQLVKNLDVDARATEFHSAGRIANAIKRG